MIGRLDGRLVEIDETHALIDVHGVGYEVSVPPHAFGDDEVGSECSMYTHLVVDANAHLLYGFKNREQREMFRLLLSVSGVGPSLALSVLSTFGVDEVIQFITMEDAAALIRVKGLGQRGAERIIVDLRNKVTDFPITLARATRQPSSVFSDAVAALSNLGYSRNDATRAVRETYSEGIELEALVRAALGALSK